MIRGVRELLVVLTACCQQTCMTYTVAVSSPSHGQSQRVVTLRVKVKPQNSGGVKNLLSKQNRGDCATIQLK